MSLNLIEKALQYAKEERIWFLSYNFGITEPLTPKAVRSHQYLLMREYINVGCRKATKLVLDHYKRPATFSILMMACMEIFQYGKDDRIIALYNDMLDKLIGTH